MISVCNPLCERRRARDDGGNWGLGAGRSCESSGLGYNDLMETKVVFLSFKISQC